MQQKHLKFILLPYSPLEDRIVKRVKREFNREKLAEEERRLKEIIKERVHSPSLKGSPSPVKKKRLGLKVTSFSLAAIPPVEEEKAGGAVPAIVPSPLRTTKTSPLRGRVLNLSASTDFSGGKKSEALIKSILSPDRSM